MNKTGHSKNGLDYETKKEREIEAGKKNYNTNVDRV
jgi:hypothetical protein